MFRRSTLLPFAMGLLLGVTATGVPAAMLGSAVFSDVPAGSYYDAAIGELYGDGVIKGYSDGRFGPDEVVTRGQVAVMLQRFKDSLDGGTSTTTSRSSRSSSSSSSSSSLAEVTEQGAFRFTTSTFTLGEGVPKITLSVVRTGGAEGAVTVKYETANGTAKSGEDFTESSGTLSFADGESSKNLTVTLKEDTTGEGTETFTIVLKSPTGGAVLSTPSTATVSITDNEAGGATSSTSSTTGGTPTSDKKVEFGSAEYSISEANSSLIVTVVRKGSTTGTATVNYETVNDSGKSGTDYVATSGTLTFSDGETSKSFNVGIAQDTDLDGSKKFKVKLTSPTNTSLGYASTATVTIMDDESLTFGSGSVKFSKSSYSVGENDGFLYVTVLRTGGADGVISVNYATSSSTAASAKDYTATAGTLTFQENESGKVIAIPILKDGETESSETFFFDLTSVTAPATLISPFSVAISIE